MSPRRYSVRCQPCSAGSNGRRAMPMIRPDLGPRLERPHRRAADVAGRPGDRDRELRVRHCVSAAAIACAVRRASAMIVSIGLVPEALGKALASPTQTPGVSWSSPRGLATEVCGSAPIRQLPIWWAEKSRKSRGAIAATLSSAMNASRSSPRVQSGALRCAADDLARAGRLVDADQLLHRRRGCRGCRARW